MHQKNPSKSRHPSISNTMQWLSRTSQQQSSTRYSPSKPTRISEPQLVRTIELLSQPLSGALGSGATIVRTPEEALRDARVRLAPEGLLGNSDSRPEKVKKPSQKRDASSTLHSPPLPPLPLPEEDEALYLSEAEEPAPSSRAAPLPPSAYPVEPSPDENMAQALSGEEVVVVHGSRVCTPEELTMLQLTFGVPSTMSPPPFEPILLSEPPTRAIDPMNVIVTLETSTETYKTSLNTLLSQPSYLADYLRSLLPRNRSRSEASSMYSMASDIAAVQEELASPTIPVYSPPSKVHIFLDRPSVPYAHVLAYLRSSTNSKGGQEPTLPFKVRLVHNYTQERLETLLEVRDEAAFLNLPGLQKLCEEELQSRQGTVLFHRPYSHDSDTLGSVHSQHASVYSLHTLIDKVEGDIRSHSHSSSESIVKERHLQRSDSKGSKRDSDTRGTKQVPTLESWTESSVKGPMGRRCSPPRPPPAGWI